jgi:hypothetical protein
MSSSVVTYDAVTSWVEDLAILDTSNGADKLDQYLAQPIKRVKVNPIQFWWDKCTMWPGLS